MAWHWPFEYLQHKLWQKERPRVKLAIWLPTTKNQESTWPWCVQKSATHRWKALKESYSFFLDLNPIEGLNKKVMIVQSLGSVATPLWPSVGVKPNTWKSWRLGVFRDSRMFRARQQGEKHLALGCSWCHWKGLET